MIDLLVLEARHLRAQLVEIREDVRRGALVAAMAGLNEAIQKLDAALEKARRAGVNV